MPNSTSVGVAKTYGGDVGRVLEQALFAAKILIVKDSEQAAEVLTVLNLDIENES